MDKHIRDHSKVKFDRDEENKCEESGKRKMSKSNDEQIGNFSTQTATKMAA